MKFRALVLFSAAAALAQGPAPDYNALVSQARDAIQGNRYETAVTKAQAAVALDGKRWEGYAAEGTALSLLGRGDEAVLMFAKAAARAPVDQAPVLEKMMQEAQAQAKNQGNTQGRQPPPPRPQDNGPGLAETMKYIQDRILGTGTLSYEQLYVPAPGEPVGPVPGKTVTVGTSLSRSGTVTNAIANPAGCTLSWVEKEATPRGENEYRLSFRDVNKVAVEPLQESLNRNRDPALHGEYRVTPSIFALRLVMNTGKRVRFYYRVTGRDRKVEETTMDLTEALIPFQAEETADRTAKAMAHAVELCGGGDNDPFK